MRSKKILSAVLAAVLAIQATALTCFADVNVESDDPSVSDTTSIDEITFYNCTSLKDVYYTGSQAQWKAISTVDENDALKNATIHYDYILKLAGLKAAPAKNSVKLT